MWDATSGGNQIQSIALQGSGGIPTNQIQSVTSGGTVNYTHDSAGNVSNDGAHTYGYDSANRLVSVDGGSTASYGYDYQNRRYKKSIGSTVTHYIWQGSQVLAEHNSSTGAVLTDYILSGSRMLAKVAGSTTNYFLSDRLSVRLTMDSNGSVVGRQAHLPFGEDFADSGTQEKHHFTSYERDSESGVDYAMNRGYSSTVGRFQAADPYRPSGYLIDPKSWNRYSYTRNEPVNRIDPSGLEDDPVDPCPSGFDCDDGPPIRLNGWADYPRTPRNLNGFPIGSNDDAEPAEDTEGSGGGATFCTISVRFRKVDITAAKLAGVYHLYIVFSDGVQGGDPRNGVGGSYYAAFPDFQNQGGRLIPTNTAYTAAIANQDWDPTGTSHPRVNHTITDGKACAEIRASFQDTHRRLQSADIKWQSAGPNSNSYIYTMLLRAGLIEHFSLRKLQQELPFQMPLPVLGIRAPPFPGWGRGLDL